MSAREFDCIECGRHIVRFDAALGEDQGLCGCCIMFPGWLKDARLRALIAPDHDGLEVVERQSLREAR